LIQFIQINEDLQQKKWVHFTETDCFVQYKF
jgi:hypothetical protein